MITEQYVRDDNESMIVLCEGVYHEAKWVGMSYAGILDPLYENPMTGGVSENHHV